MLFLFDCNVINQLNDQAIGKKSAEVAQLKRLNG